MSWITAMVLVISCSFGASSSRNIQAYGFDSKNLPKSILAKVAVINNEMTSEAHILRAFATDSSNGVQLSFDLTDLPNYFQATFIMDELFLDFKSPNNDASATAVNQDLWIADSSSKTTLARVSLEMGRTGYQRIILGKWSKSQSNARDLHIEIRPGPLTSKGILGSRALAYLVAYTHPLANPQAAILKPVNLLRPVCNSHVINVPTGGFMLPRKFQTVVCSPLANITFPLNDSSIFDVGQAVRKYLTLHPIPGNSKVLQNPTCCHAVRATSLNFLLIGRGVFGLSNANITKCGCQEF